LNALGRIAAVKVVAPNAVFEYGNAAHCSFRAVITPRQEQVGPLEVLRPPWAYPPFGGCANAFFLFLQLLAPIILLHKRFQFQLIDAHFGHPDGVAAALLAKVFHCPFTITLRGNETMHSRYFFRRWAIKWAIRRAAGIITVSERLRQFAIVCGADPAKTRTIPNGVDTSVFHPRGRAEVRKKHGLNAGIPLILSAGYLIERKGHHRILRALHAMHQRGARARLVIAGGPGGEGKFEPALRRLVQELMLQDSVTFTGQVSPETLAELMSAADLLCLATTREGWPNVVNEALACGCPVVATDVGGIPDLIPSEKYGFVVPVGNQEALESAIEKALRLQWDREAIAAWGASRSWEQVAAEVLEEFKRIIAE
jgi:glycosyltransferase involved in cell wall biosynthesis